MKPTTTEVQTPPEIQTPKPAVRERRQNLQVKKRAEPKNIVIIPESEDEKKARLKRERQEEKLRLEQERLAEIERKKIEEEELRQRVQICAAAERGPKEKLTELLEGTSQTNKDYALMHAIKAWNEVNIDTALAAGANINGVVDVKLQRHGKEVTKSLTPLGYVAYTSHVAGIRGLLIRGANPDFQGPVNQLGYSVNNWKTALMVAAENASSEAIEALVEGVRFEREGKIVAVRSDTKRTIKDPREKRITQMLTYFDNATPQVKQRAGRIDALICAADNFETRGYGAKNVDTLIKSILQNAENPDEIHNLFYDIKMYRNLNMAISRDTIKLLSIMASDQSTTCEELVSGLARGLMIRELNRHNTSNPSEMMRILARLKQDHPEIAPYSKREDMNGIIRVTLAERENQERKGKKYVPFDMPTDLRFMPITPAENEVIDQLTRLKKFLDEKFAIVQHKHSDSLQCYKAVKQVVLKLSQTYQNPVNVLEDTIDFDIHRDLKEEAIKSVEEFFQNEVKSKMSFSSKLRKTISDAATSLSRPSSPIKRSETRAAITENEEQEISAKQQGGIVEQLTNFTNAALARVSPISFGSSEEGKKESVVSRLRNKVSQPQEASIAISASTSNLQPQEEAKQPRLKSSSTKQLSVSPLKSATQKFK